MQTNTVAVNKPLTEIDSFKKGEQFEQYIIQLFNKRSFDLKQWRKSKKFEESFLPGDHFNPDIEMEFVFTGARKYRFAVECKWRKEFKNGRITWATDKQRNSYRSFQAQTGIPVFVAIGIGGGPGNPEQLYLTPLDNIHRYSVLFSSDLIRFERNPKRRLYYNFEQLQLF